MCADRPFMYEYACMFVSLHLVWVVASNGIVLRCGRRETRRRGEEGREGGGGWKKKEEEVGSWKTDRMCVTEAQMNDIMPKNLLIEADRQRERERQKERQDIRGNDIEAGA